MNVQCWSWICTQISCIWASGIRTWLRWLELWNSIRLRGTSIVHCYSNPWNKPKLSEIIVQRRVINLALLYRHVIKLPIHIDNISNLTPIFWSLPQFPCSPSISIVITSIFLFIWSNEVNCLCREKGLSNRSHHLLSSSYLMNSRALCLSIKEF